MKKTHNVMKDLQKIRHAFHPWKKNPKISGGEMDIDRLQAQHIVPGPRQNRNPTKEKQG